LNHPLGGHRPGWAGGFYMARLLGGGVGFTLQVVAQKTPICPHTPQSFSAWSGIRPLAAGCFSRKPETCRFIAAA